MKTFFNIVNNLSAMMYNFILVLLLTGAMAASGFYMNPFIVFIVISALMLRFRGKPSVGNVLFAATFQDVWVSWILDNFYANFPFLSKMRNLTEFVKNDIINVREIGADPTVWINNNTYPIPTLERTDNNYPIELDKYETLNTAISLKESQRLNYDKVMTATSQHQKALMQKAQEKWTHALGALSNAALTPVIECTGADRGDGTKKLTALDLLALQAKFDNLLVPVEGRVLCLSTTHRADLVAEDLPRFKTLANLKSGQFESHFGFDIFSSPYVPKYHKTNLTKNAFGAAATANDAFASIAWHEDEVGYAKGSMTMHYKPSAINTEFRRDEVGFTMYGIGLPLRPKFYGAIVSKAV